MAIGEICSRDVVFVSKNESAADAARLMREHHIGSVVVAERKGERVVPAGMITDRDIAVGVWHLASTRKRRRSRPRCAPAWCACRNPRAWAARWT